MKAEGLSKLSEVAGPVSEPGEAGVKSDVISK